MNRHEGAWLLLTQHLRRDRRLVAIWLVALGAMVYVSATATTSLYPDTADRITAAEALNSSGATVALYGPILDVSSEGEFAMTKLTVVYALVAALLLLVVVRRHTRTEEESGRAELVGSAAIGLYAPLTGALVLGALLSLLVGALAAIADAAGGLPVSGSIAFGASWAGICLVGAAVTAVCCQLSASSRACAGMTLAAFAALYLVRAVADVEAPWVGWLTPFGWGTRLRAWSDPRWWVLALYVALALVLAMLAYVLRARRDLGTGLWPARPGRASGAPWLGDVLSLTWRLDRATTGWWTLAVGIMGALFGFIAPSVTDLLDTEAGREMIEAIGGAGRLEDALLAAVLSISGIVITCFGITVLVRAANDERDSRAELVLSSATSRTRALWSAVAVALAGVVWLNLVTAVAMSLASGRGPVALVPAALGQVPAAATILAVTAALYAGRAAWTAAGWGVVLACVLLDALGGLLELPSWVIKASPYAHVPAMPAESFELAPAVVLALVAAIVLAGATVRYRSRDLA